MHFKGLDLNLLVALDALLMEKSISRAAERLNLSQSGMSGALSRLRQYFQDDLLVQSGRKMMPTSLANSLAVSIREVLANVERTVISQHRFDPSSAKRTLRIMTSDYVSTVLLPNLSRRMQNEAPSIALEIFPLMEDPVAALELGRVDILISPKQYLSLGHPVDHLFEDYHVCIADAANETVRGDMTIERFLSLEMVTLRFGQARQTATDGPLLEQYGRTGPIAVVAPNFSAIPYFLIGTKRISLVLSRLASHFASLFPLQVLPCPIEVPSLTEGLQWHARSANDPVLKWFRTLVMEEVQSRFSS